ncbi:MAG: NapC/NirT family cytochrome c [Candidatus Bipolaricaulota bacterium]|nr:NapC/NirT family cytochrome c [Candidatus Bipolaricaulota bacterium]MDW8030340.1 cytochrome c3 family protein [Candidatus Bipolaricaulota bacterium]
MHKDLACTSCHSDVHRVPHEPPPAPVTAHACAGCHPEQVQQYQQSIHGQAQAQGIGEAARCADCHSVHAIFPKFDSRSSVFVRNLPRTCGRCHERSELSERFGIAARRYSTYWESYHGLSVKYGNLIAANCSSCHGSHLILATSDPQSSVHPNNLPQTCGQCHPNASANLLQGKVHVEARLEVSPGVYVVHVFYIVFLGIFGALFAFHVTLDIIRWWRRRYAQRPGQGAE